MPLVILLIGAILIVAAIRDTQGDLFAALKEDVPAFTIWAAAIVAIGILGYIPGFKPISRGLLALIIVVLVVNNYDKVLSGFTAAWKTPAPVGGTSESSSSGGSGLGDFLGGLPMGDIIAKGAQIGSKLPSGTIVD